MPYVEVFLQTVLAFAAIFIYTRILGKQQIGQLTFFEYITGITFGSIAAVLATDIGPQKTWVHFWGLTVFASLTFLMGYVALESRPARKLIAGEPTVVVHNGKILEENMKKMRYNMDELMMQMREKNVFNLADVEFAVLEPNGSLSVLPRAQKRPLTPADLQLPTAYEGLTTELIVDGQILFQNLEQVQLDRQWLLDQLKQRGVQDLRQVAYAGLDSAGQFILDVREDQLGNTASDFTDDPAFPQPPPNPGN